MRGWLTWILDIYLSLSLRVAFANRQSGLHIINACVTMIEHLIHAVNNLCIKLRLTYRFKY